MKSQPRNDFERQLYEQVERETRRSRHRERISGRCGTFGRIAIGKRVHPYQHDINELVAFLISRRLRQAGMPDLVRRIRRSVDTQALRLALEMVREKGSFDMVMRRRCERIEGYCNLIEAALFFGSEFRRHLAQEDHSLPEDVTHD